MAKTDKKKKKKQKLKVTKQPVNMLLAQNKNRSKEKTRADKDHVYKLFRRRVLTKSNHKWFSLGEKPILLRLNQWGTSFDSTNEFLVQVGSFEPIMGGKDNKVEIGFEVMLKSNLTPDKVHRLRVMRKAYKATLFITL